MISPAKLMHFFYSCLHPTDDRQLLLLAKLLLQGQRGIKYKKIQEAEFKVYSQFGDDGIIQYLINRVKLIPAEERFIEIGVENYQEANTRFLLLNNNWSGLIIDGSSKNIEEVKKQQFFWQHDLTAIDLFVTKKNILKILENHNFINNIGILSIDIDGNDYWILKELINLRPVIIIAEYNSLFGIKHPVTIPYKKNFQRTAVHFSNLFWGCSLKALDLLARENSYTFVGTNSAGNNAYFIREDRLGKITSTTLEKGYTQAKYRESRNTRGQLTFLNGGEQLKLISNNKLFHLGKNQLIKVREIFKVNEDSH